MARCMARINTFTRNIFKMSEDKSFVFKEDLLNKFRYFIEDNDGNKVARNLRKIFFDYMRFQQYNFDIEFEEMLDDVENVIQLMELLGEERRRSVKG